jgi:glutamate-1-semialdehyde aminotransferase/3-oxoacyl-(acyl-carrier-protein) synthase
MAPGQEMKTKIFELIQQHKLTAEEGLQILKGLSTPRGASRDVAVIGMSGRFPDAENVDEFWENLKAGRHSIREVLGDRWDADAFYDPDPQKPNRSYSKWGGFLSDIDRFDPSFFKISPREAELMDPQQRLFLQESWAALEDAGYSPPDLTGKRCGVFVGSVAGDYLNQIREKKLSPEGHFFLGNVSSVLASRVAYHLNFTGPAVSLDTACSSSLVAVHMAAESIRLGDCELALAGGVMIFTTPEFFIWASKAGMLSPGDKCRTFDNDANGMIIGETVGVVVLKPLESALKDGTHIYGIIKGSGLNQDGATNGITVPNASSQTDLERSVYDAHNIEPENITLVEAHGTGTKLGDPIEVEALSNAFRSYTDKKQYCAIGSVKTNFGHTQMAAGIAGLIKVLLCLKHKKLPASLHLKKENEHIDFKNSPFYVNTELKEWETRQGVPRCAAVSAFGVSGTNAHVVVEEFEHEEPAESPGPHSPQLIVLSAKNDDRLREVSQNLLISIRKPSMNGRKNLAHISYTLQKGREAMNSRLALVVSNIEELESKLVDFYEGRAGIKGLYQGVARKDRGQGVQNPLLSGKEGEAFIQIILKEKNFDKVARLWVEGESIDWDLIHPSPKPKRVSLPTYPFAKERYWIPDNEGGNKTPEASRPQDEKRKPAGRDRPWGRTEGNKLQANLEITTDYTCTRKQKEFIKAFIADYEKRTKKSKEAAIRYRRYFADQRTSVYFNALLKEIHYPFTYKKASGAYIHDIDGNKYIDISGDYGVNLFGHQPPFITRVLKNQIDNGFSLSGRYDAIGKAAELFCDLTGDDRIVFCQSGSESLMSALRIARAYTAKKKFVMFRNSYHGIVDCFLDGVWPGLVESSVEDQILLEYGKTESLAAISEHADDLAAIIVEPVQSANMGMQPRDFLHALRSLTTQKGIVLIFDEMISGFRVHVKGAQGAFGLKADLSTHGKILGGGMPCGAVAGREDIMKWVDGGQWKYGDASKPGPITRIAGTHTQNPLKMAAILAVLREIKKESPALQENLSEKTGRIVTRINRYTRRHNIPMEIVSFGSIFRFRFMIDRFTLTQALFLNLLNHNNIRYNLHGNCFLTAGHTDNDIETIIGAIENSLDILMREGFFYEPETTAVTVPIGTPCIGKKVLAREELKRLLKEDLNRLMKNNK